MRPVLSTGPPARQASTTASTAGPTHRRGELIPSRLDRYRPALLAEMSSIIPTAGGGYGFARRALGPWGGFMTGTAVLLEYVLAPAAVVTFIGAYTESLFVIYGWNL